MLNSIFVSYSLTIWYCMVIVSFARLAPAGLEVGSWWFSFRMPRQRLDQLVDPSSEAKTRNAARFRARAVQFLFVLVLSVPALLL